MVLFNHEIFSAFNTYIPFHTHRETKSRTHTSAGRLCARESPAAKVFTTRSSEQTKSNRAQQSRQIFTYVHTQLYTYIQSAACICVCVCMVSRKSQEGSAYNEQQCDNLMKLPSVKRCKVCNNICNTLDRSAARQEEKLDVFCVCMCVLYSMSLM